jgi:hypothetical protein
MNTSMNNSINNSMNNSMKKIARLSLLAIRI